MKPLVAHLRVADPALAARIAEYGQRVAEEICARHTYPPEVLDRVAALLGPVPRVRRDAPDGADTGGGATCGPG